MGMCVREIGETQIEARWRIEDTDLQLGNAVHGGLKYGRLEESQGSQAVTAVKAHEPGGEIVIQPSARRKNAVICVIHLARGICRSHRSVMRAASVTTTPHHFRDSDNTSVIGPSENTTFCDWSRHRYYKLTSSTA